MWTTRRARIAHHTKTRIALHLSRQFQLALKAFLLYQLGLSRLEPLICLLQRLVFLL